MKLILHTWDTKLDAARAYSELHADEVDPIMLRLLPRVWADDGRQLHPSDGDAWLLAVHEELKRGSMGWSELVE